MNDFASQLKALADPVRLSILEFLLNPIQTCCAREEGVCACDFENVLSLSQPSVSHHMKILVQVGFVQAEKRGRWVYYALEPSAFEAVRERLGRFAGATPTGKEAEHAL
jgi:ArsR family transcriptional regulator